MFKRIIAIAAFAIIPILGACDETPTGIAEGAQQAPSFSVIGAEPLVGAIVLNQGEASEPFTGTCTIRGQVTTDVTLVRTPNGGGLLSCHWTPWIPSADFNRAVVVRDFGCRLNFFGFSTTNRTTFVRSQNETARMTCTFDSVPTPPTSRCYGQITSGIASTWPWAHNEQGAFPPPPGSLALWLEDFGPSIGISTVHELQLLFCGP